MRSEKKKMTERISDNQNLDYSPLGLTFKPPPLAVVIDKLPVKNELRIKQNWLLTSDSRLPAYFNNYSLKIYSHEHITTVHTQQ
jgi:hypothetical protein